MTAQVLSTELGTIIQETRKKYPDVRNAAERALQELKALPVTSEVQLALDLGRRSQFADPFFLACSTRNVKVVLPAVSCLHRLVVSLALQAGSLEYLVKAYQEISNLNQDIQIKILQTLPLLLQNYGQDLEGDLIAGVLQTCAVLQQVKAPAVANIASATLQQVVIFVFEKVEIEDRKEPNIHASVELSAERGSVPLGIAAHDAYRLFRDLCLLTEGAKAQFMQGAILTMGFGLELLESILNNHADLISSHPELVYLLKHDLLPLVTRFISERLDFSTTARTIRILCILLREHLAELEAEFEVPLSLLVYYLEADALTPWRRALAMEAFKIVYSHANLATGIYAHFDSQTGRRSIIQDSMSTFVRMAAEKPSVIGLGKQSSAPQIWVGGNGSSQEQAGLESGSAAEIMVGAPGTKLADTVGISMQWSVLKPSCLDSLDKLDPPIIPESYVYGLILVCINNLVESLAKIILPLTVQSQSKHKIGSNDLTTSDERQSLDEKADSRSLNEHNESSTLPSDNDSRAVPVNPLDLHNHRSYGTVQITASLVEQCWPAILATFSTFFNASLDADFYRMLIRSTQKLTQVAGVLRLTIARDAFLTTLAKAAVPLNMLHTDILSPSALTPDSPKLGSNNSAFKSVETFFNQVTLDASRRPSMDVNAASLNQRNLVCLRALINLAIALGPVFDHAWSIVLETLQKADVILSASNSTSSRDQRPGPNTTNRLLEDNATGSNSLQSEIAAVDAATDRLIESTVDWPDQSFITLLDILCKQIHDNAPPTSKIPASPRRALRRMPSMTGISMANASQPQYDKFNISKLGRLVEVNVHRFAERSFEEGFTTLTQALLNVATVSSNDRVFRIMSADLLRSLAAELVLITVDVDTALKVQIQIRSLDLLHQVILALYNSSPSGADNSNATSLEVHRSILMTVGTILEKCGESLTAGWPTILAIIGSVFRTRKKTELAEEDVCESGDDEDEPPLIPISTKLVQTSFASVQLICSDLFSLVPPPSLLVLINHLLYGFGSQRKDLNISLTTITLFWNVSDALQGQANELALPDGFDARKPRAELIHLSIDAAERGSRTAMWMTAQLRLASMTTDPRPDVRNGAIHTIFRILDSCGDRMSQVMWETYIRSVLLPMLEGHGEELSNIDDTEHMASVEGSLKIILYGLNSIFAGSFDILVGLSAFDEIWHSILIYLDLILQSGSYSMNKVVFDSLAQTLGPLEDGKKLDQKSALEVAKLWIRCIPNPSEKRAATNVNEAALIAYVELLSPIHRLINGDTQMQQVSASMKNLQKCIELSRAASYGSDIDTLTKLQTVVLDAFHMMQADIDLDPLAAIRVLADFSMLPYKQGRLQQEPKRCSFVAFAKSSMDFLESVMIKHLGRKDVYQEGGYAAATRVLISSIQQKYQWEPQGKSPALWRKATTTTVAILENSLPVIENLNIEAKQHEEIWSNTIELFNSIAHADLATPPSNSTLLLDETFDMAALKQLTNIITTSLTPKNAPDRARNAYLYALFTNSLIHAPQSSELPSLPDNSPLKELYKIRSGRTFDPPFNRRIRMSYLCLDELFSLAATSPEDQTRTTATNTTLLALARTALPYVILRCALPLKSYIADQPLRGRMPTPQSQRLELLHVLKKIAELTYDAAAFPVEDEVGGDARVAVTVRDGRRRHLEWLAPLVSRALGEAGRDVEVGDALKKVMDVVVGTA